MAAISATSHRLLFFTTLSLSSLSLIILLSATTVIQDLNNLHPPPDFNTTISNNCKNNPSLRYCRSSLSSSDLEEIFKFTIVASHLCNISKNPNCKDSFSKVDLRNRPRISPLYLSFAFFWKYCPLAIISIDLANSSLKGPFPYDIFHCSQIQALDLSHNEFTGDLPLQNFSVFSNLSFLNLSYNHFTESKISKNEFFRRFNSSSFLYSGLIPDHKSFRTKALLLLIGFPIFVLLLVVLFFRLCFPRPDILPNIFQRKHRFTPSMLKAATDGFSKKNLVAMCEGVHIYRGLLRDGFEARIEVYEDDISREDDRESFVKECKVLVQLCHKNLVRVLGWCDSRRLRAVVAEWIEGENVQTWLLRSDPPWKHRVEVIMKILEGMLYLEAEWPQVGYDLNTSGILLSEHGEPFISRFRIGDHNSFTEKVYKFGVLVLEMVANRRPTQEFKGGEAGFIEWMRNHFRDKVFKSIDIEEMKKKKKKKTTEQHSVDKAIELGLMCTDLSRGHHYQLTMDKVSEAMTAICASVLASASPTHKRSREQRTKKTTQISSSKLN